MSISPIRLRAIEASDNPAVAEIIRQVMTEFACVGEGYSINDPEVDQMFESYLAPEAAFYVIERDGELLGCGGFGPLADEAADICELKKMYFLKDLRGAGWGRRMLQYCIDQARKAGYRQMYLETVNRMNAANGLYRSFGFKPLDGPLGATGHGGCDAFYVKSI